MQFRESTTVELKSQYVDDIKKEIIAFANVRGGAIYIGINDDGTVCGIDKIDYVTNQISAMVRDAIKPDLTRFVDYENLRIEDKDVLKITVEEGTNKPYYIGKHGLRPTGVYVRQGNECAPASEDSIRLMIKLTDGDDFESCRSMNQDLTFISANREFAKRNMTIDPAKETTLGITKSLDGIYTNLGLLLSDQCPYTIKCAVFGGTDQSNFVDRREFTGSILQQMEECYAYIDLNNPTAADFDGLYRKDSRDFPVQALREALLNSMVHRDYSYSASTLISFYSDRIEFVSVGGLLPGIQLEDVMMGLSICRNQKLADIFYRMNLIEAYGTGLQKIQNLYKDSTPKPQILVAPNSFKIILPRMRSDAAQSIIREESRPFHSDYERIEELISYKGEVPRSDIDQALGVSQATASRMIKHMLDTGILEKRGNGKNIRYRLKK